MAVGTEELDHKVSRLFKTDGLAATAHGECLLLGEAWMLNQPPGAFNAAARVTQALQPEIDWVGFLAPASGSDILTLQLIFARRSGKIYKRSVRSDGMS